MKAASADVKEAIQRLMNTHEFQQIVGWFQASREELRQSAEMPSAQNREFFCGAASTLSEILQLTQRK